MPSGQPFSGRSQGGGTRGQIYGNRAYGSGYPGYDSRGVAGRGFPFYFWPLAWGIIKYGGAHYLHNDEYGTPANSSRPGGSMTYTLFSSNDSNASQTTFRLLADNETTYDLIDHLYEACGSRLPAQTLTQSPQLYTGNISDWPRPEQVIQYYRASSIALSLDSYNNSIYGNESVPDAPLPTDIDSTLLSCLNQTIGEATPLIDGDPSLAIQLIPIIVFAILCLLLGITWCALRRLRKRL